MSEWVTQRCRALLYARFLFWTEWLRSNQQSARIGRAVGDGSNVTYIRTSQLGWPNGLAVDIRFRRVWWCDAMFDRYQSSFWSSDFLRYSVCFILSRETSISSWTGAPPHTLQWSKPLSADLSICDKFFCSYYFVNSGGKMRSTLWLLTLY